MRDLDHPAPFASLADLEACLQRMEAIASDEEGLTELAHGLQCADVLREWKPDDLELQVAGLVHDIGSALGHPRDHGRVGAVALHGVLGERVSELVRLHVDAKRYLVTVDPNYFARLSSVSLRTLRLQGGMMEPEEARLFGSNRFCDDAIRLRQADDLAKAPGRPTRTVDDWIHIVRQVYGTFS